MFSLGHLGGSSLESATRKVLEKAIENDFAKQLNWCGKRGTKTGLSKFKLADILISEFTVIIEISKRDNVLT